MSVILPRCVDATAVISPQRKNPAQFMATRVFSRPQAHVHAILALGQDFYSRKDFEHRKA